MNHFLTPLIEDLRFYQQLQNPGKKNTPLSSVLTLIISRGLWLLWMQRLTYFCYVRSNRKTPVWWIARVLSALGKYRNTLISKSELLVDCQIKGVAYLPDRGYLICGAWAIGNGTIIHDHVTFGFANRLGADGRPEVGANAWIGPNCIIAGPIVIGDGSTILPGTYVTFNIPPRSVVGGNPGRIIATEFDNAALRQSLNIVTELPQKS